MKIDTIAAQLYTVRDFTKTEADFGTRRLKLRGKARPFCGDRRLNCCKERACQTSDLRACRRLAEPGV